MSVVRKALNGGIFHEAGLAIYRQGAVCYTDFWQSDAAIFPSKRHRPVGKETGKTSAIERFNLSLPQRCSRRVGTALAFSRKLGNHRGTLWYFTHNDNARICARLALNTTSACLPKSVYWSLS